MNAKMSGGQAAPPPIFNAPPVVIGSVLMIAAVYFGTAMLPREVGLQLEAVLGVTPARFAAGPSANGGFNGMIRPLFSTIIVHGSLSHLAMNSIWLIAFGTPVARRLGAGRSEKGTGSLQGAAIFLLFFAFSGAAGALTYIAFHLNEYALLVGASGSISGLLGAIVRFSLQRPAFFAPGPQPLLPLFSPPVLAASLVVIVLNAGVEIFGGALGPSNIAWEAHIGGFVFGVVAFPAFDLWARLTGTRR